MIKKRLLSCLQEAKQAFLLLEDKESYCKLYIRVYFYTPNGKLPVTIFMDIAAVKDVPSDELDEQTDMHYFVHKKVLAELTENSKEVVDFLMDLEKTYQSKMRFTIPYLLLLSEGMVEKKKLHMKNFVKLFMSSYNRRTFSLWNQEVDLGFKIEEDVTNMFDDFREEKQLMLLDKLKERIRIAKSEFEALPKDEFFDHFCVNLYFFQNYRNRIFLMMDALAVKKPVPLEECDESEFRFLGNCEVLAELTDDPFQLFEFISDSSEFFKEQMVITLPKPLMAYHCLSAEKLNDKVLAQVIRYSISEKDFLFWNNEVGFRIVCHI